MHQPLMSLRRFGAFLRPNAAASERDWQSQSPPARKCPFIPSWTLIDVPTTGSFLIYSHFVQTVLTSRLPFTGVAFTQSDTDKSPLNRRLLEAVTAGSIEDATRLLKEGAKSISELYSHLHEELQVRLDEAERVGFGQSWLLYRMYRNCTKIVQ